MKQVKDSIFWEALWEHYKSAPSIAFCRVPELEYASGLDVNLKVLDHCCGDGIFASLAWPNMLLEAGCDIQAHTIQNARQKRIYKRADICDVSAKLPYEDKTFDIWTAASTGNLEAIKAMKID